MKVKVMLLGTQERCAQLQMHLRDDEIGITGVVSNENEVLDEINRQAPDLILVTDTTPMALRSCHQIYLLRPRSVPVVITNTEDPENIQRIVQSGVHYILSTDIDSFELITELKSIYGNEINRIMTLENSVSASSKSRVLMVFGPKDGVGKTTIAVNLAVKLIQKKNKVCILDYNLQFGNVAAFLGIKTKETIVELLQEQSNPTLDAIRQFLSLHTSGIYCLPAPNNPEDAKTISTVQIERIIATLRVYYDYIIIDAAAGFDDINVSCIDVASQILLVTGTDVPSLMDTKKSLSILKALTDEEKIKLVVGKDHTGQLKDAEISRVMGMPIWNRIPCDDRSACSAANLGSPLMLEYPRSKICRAISIMADGIDGRGTTIENGPQRKFSWGRKGN
ncbi:AAA family ATPase [Johnsonella ignava]|nr:P-loop NTPase [Johnsonella ignava]